jgi:hypothetical protein
MRQQMGESQWNSQAQFDNQIPMKSGRGVELSIKAFEHLWKEREHLLIYKLEFSTASTDRPE